MRCDSPPKIFQDHKTNESTLAQLSLGRHLSLCYLPIARFEDDLAGTVRVRGAPRIRLLGDRLADLTSGLEPMKKRSSLGVVGAASLDWNIADLDVNMGIGAAGLN